MVVVRLCWRARGWGWGWGRREDEVAGTKASEDDGERKWCRENVEVEVRGVAVWLQADRENVEVEVQVEAAWLQADRSSTRKRKMGRRGGRRLDDEEAEAGRRHCPGAGLLRALGGRLATSLSIVWMVLCGGGMGVVGGLVVWWVGVGMTIERIHAERAGAPSFM